jgi:hypothetical protein
MQIENNVELPKKRPRARKAKKDKRNAAEGLIKALKFILPSQNKLAHCYIGNGYVIGENNMFLMATKIEEDLNACPNSHIFLDALLNCESELQITQLSEFELSVKSGSFTSSVACQNWMPTMWAEATFDVRALFLDALQTVYKIASDNSETYKGGVLVNGQSCVVTDDSILVESWHGTGFPNPFIVPKLPVKLACSDNFVKLGLSDNTITFQKEDGSFIVSKFIEDKFQPYEHFFNVPEDSFEYFLPKGFKKAVESLAPFAKDVVINFVEDGLSVTDGFYKIDGLPINISFNIASLLKVIDLIDTFVVHENKMIFKKGYTRGILMGMTNEQENKIL